MTQRASFELDVAMRLTIGKGAHVIDIAPEAGGRIVRFQTNGRDWLAPIEAKCWLADAWLKDGCYPLVPFSNRVRDSRFPAPDGEVVRLDAFASQPHALHGFGTTPPGRWKVTPTTASCCVTRMLRPSTAGRGPLTRARRSGRPTTARG